LRTKTSPNIFEISELSGSGDLLRGIPEDGSDPSRVTIGVDEGSPLDAILSLPSDGGAGVSLLQVKRLRITIPSQGRSQLIGDVQQPGVSGIGGRRFFSSAAKELFEYLFRDVETRKYWDASEKKPMTVVRELPEGSELFRARICHSNEDLKDALKDPYKNVGPPPPARARAGRTNVDGVAVFYGALDSDTCLAELRPAIGGEAAVIKVRTTRPLRLLDFTKIKDSYHVLSYFQSDFNKQAEKNAFLRHLGNLISQPVRPGQEADYLITQTMAEYLAHVHGEKSDGKLFQSEPFDGLLFESVQKTGGTNVVSFPKPKDEADNAFPLAYVDDSVRVFRTMTIEYKHHDMRLGLMDDGEIIQSSDGDEFSDEE
jgi:hypothetical protein